MTWLRIAMAIAQTFNATMLWHFYLAQLGFEREYSGEILAAAHYQRWESLGAPVGATLAALAMWGLAGFAILLEDRAESRRRYGV